MAAGIPFIGETGRKAVQNGERSNSENDHGFWTLFVIFERKNSLLLLLTSNLSFSHTFTTVFVNTRLWKTKHTRKRFQTFR